MAHLDPKNERSRLDPPGLNVALAREKKGKLTALGQPLFLYRVPALRSDRPAGSGRFLLGVRAVFSVVLDRSFFLVGCLRSVLIGPPTRVGLSANELL